eukprot:245012_1
MTDSCYRLLSSIKTFPNNVGYAIFYMDAKIHNREDVIHKNIRKWKYNSRDDSFIYPYIKEHICSLSEHIPFHISPNIITIIGFVFSILNVFICTYFQTQSVWKHFIVCIFILIAFTFDALDGMQGRKWLNTKRDVYVLTQLFDHGFDSLTSVLMVFVYTQICDVTAHISALLLVSIFFAFLNETIKYKRDKWMIFGIANNPTEITFLFAAFILFNGFEDRFHIFQMYVPYFVIFVDFLFPIYELFACLMD